MRWRRLDLKRVIAEKFGVDFHPRYVGKLLKKLGFSTSVRGPVIQLSGARADRRGFQKRMARPRLQGGFCRDVAADPVCFNVSGLEEVPPAMMEIRALRSSPKLPASDRAVF